MAEPRTRILVVDDDGNILRLLRWRLEPEYEVITAMDGRQALAEIAKKLPDLVITDRMMPEISGSQLVERLRAHPATAAVPIIMLTARGSTEDKVEGLEVGADDYLAKPFEAAELVARVKAALRRARLPGPAAAGSPGRAISPDAKGYIAGLSLPSVLQMLNLDRASCDLRVAGGGRVGIMTFDDGELISANDGKSTGNAAVYEILSWPDVTLELWEPSRPVGSPIRDSLSRILMVAVRLQDERAAATKRAAAPAGATPTGT